MTLAIDLGTTNLKVGLVNEFGEIISLCSSSSPKVENSGGDTEHDPKGLKVLIMDLCRKALRNCQKQDVKYIVPSTYQFGLMMMDKWRRPITGMTLLTDIRSQFTFSDFVSSYEQDNVYQKTGCPLISQYVLPRLFYFSRERQELLRRTRYFTDSKSFLFEWLTGEYVTDISTAAATQFYNLRHYNWDKGLLSKLKLLPDQFPATKDGTQYMAPLRNEICEELGLKHAKVLLGVYDGAALGIGLSGLAPDVGIINIGTTAMLRVPGANAVFDYNRNKRIQAYAVQRGFFFNGGALNNAALPLNWMRSNLFDFDPNETSLLQPRSTRPLISLPYLTGERDSETGPYASGVFFGIRRYHTQMDFTRSILEGVVYSIRYIYEALLENDLQMKEVRMGGGGINIQAWPQIFADVLNLPVVLSRDKEAGLIGNAILAFTAGGCYKTFEEAYGSMSKPGTIVEPDSSVIEVRNKQYRFFKKLRETLAPLYREYNELEY